VTEFIVLTVAEVSTYSEFVDNVILQQFTETLEQILRIEDITK